MSRDSVAQLPFVSRETLADLESLVAAMEKWTVRINLISKSTIPAIWTRHILDSLQIWPLSSVSQGVWADLGSGGGLPALPLACVAKHAAPDIRFVLVESDQRKSAFLRDTAIRLNLNVEVKADRIEAVPPLAAHVLTARALAPLSDLLGLSEPHIEQGGTLILPKGANHEAEVKLALDRWSFSVQTHPSQTDNAGVLLRIKDLRRA